MSQVEIVAAALAKNLPWEPDESWNLRKPMMTGLDIVG
jgi:hypothetical protein